MRCEGPKPTHGSQIKRRVGADRAGSIMRVGVVSHSSSEKRLNTLHAAGRKATPSCTVEKKHTFETTAASCHEAAQGHTDQG